MVNFWVFLCGFFVSLGPFNAFGNVVLIGKNVTLSFEDREATFGE